MKKLKNIVMLVILVVLQSCMPNRNKEESKEINLERIDSISTNLDVMDSLKLKKEKQFIKLAPNKELQEDCDCNVIAYITKSPKRGIELFNQEKKVVNRVFFDEENEEFVTVELKNYKEGLFQIASLVNPFKEDTDKNNEFANLWIENTQVRVYLPDADKDISLYLKSDEKSEIIKKVNALEKYAITPIKCCEKWIYGIYHDKNDKQTKGWFHPDDICSSPITNC